MNPDPGDPHLPPPGPGATPPPTDQPDAPPGPDPVVGGAATPAAGGSPSKARKRKKTDPVATETLTKRELEQHYYRSEAGPEADRMRRGWLGRVVGTHGNAPNNIAFFVLLLTFTAGFVFGLVDPAQRIEFWKLLAPLITLAMGYVFGKNT